MAGEARIRELQRLAYGADASDAERAQAVDELARLATHGLDHAVSTREGGSSRGAHGEATDASDVPGSPDATAARASTERAQTTAQHRHGTVVRWSAAAGGVGLLLGALIGWGIAQRLPADSVSNGAAAPTPSSMPGTALEDTDLPAVFDRLPQATESARVVDVVDDIDPASVRLLATRVDGPAAYLARTNDGENVCLVLLLPAGSPRSECTVDGELPAEGLRILYGAQGYGLAAARLGSTGVVSLGLIAGD